MACPELVSFLPVIEKAQLGSSSPLRSTAYTAFFPLVMSSSILGLSLSIQNYMRIDFFVFTCGMSRTGSVSALPAVDCVHLGFFLLAQSLMHLAPGLLIVDFQTIGSSPSPQSLSWSASTVSILGIVRESVLLVLDLVQLELLLLPRSHSHAGFAIFACGLVHSNLPLFLRSFGYLELVVFVLGLSCLESIFSPFVIEKSHLDFSFLSRSLAKLGSVLLVFDLLHLGFVLFIRSFAYMGFPLLFSGNVCAGSLSSLPVVETMLLGLLVLLRNLAWCGFEISALDFSQSDLLPFAHTLSHLELPVFPICMATLGSLLFVFDFSNVELFVFLKSIA